MFHPKFFPSVLAGFALAATQSLSAMAQPWPASTAQSTAAPGGPVSTLRDPLIDGAPTSPAFLPAAEGQPPPVGAGNTPAAVNPGMGGAPTLLPWVPAVPANSADLSTSGVALPVNPAVVSAPGVLGPALTGLVPGPQSTLGSDPGSLTAPAGYENVAKQVNVNPDGSLPGVGGYLSDLNSRRRGGQETRQYEVRGRNAAMGGLGGDGSQDNVTRMGPWAGWGLLTGVPTGNGLRNGSIDLGGGQRVKVAGQIISTGSTIQDFGNSDTRNNPIPALHAQPAYDFGQGRHDQPVYSAKTTDYGGAFKQFSQANVSAQKIGQKLPPTAVETNK